MPENSPLQIETSHDASNRVLVVRMIGDASMGAIAVLARANLSIAAQRLQAVVFDMAMLTFLASLAMGELVRVTHAVKEFGGKVVIAAPETEVRSALLRARLDRVMPIYDSAPQAVEALASSAVE